MHCAEADLSCVKLAQLRVPTRLRMRRATCSTPARIELTLPNVDLNYADTARCEALAELLLASFRELSPDQLPTLTAARDRRRSVPRGEVSVGSCQCRHRGRSRGPHRQPPYARRLWELHPLAVAPAQRRRGGGRRLVDSRVGVPSPGVGARRAQPRRRQRAGRAAVHRPRLRRASHEPPVRLGSQRICIPTRTYPHLGALSARRHARRPARSELVSVARSAADASTRSSDAGTRRPCARHAGASPPAASGSGHTRVLQVVEVMRIVFARRRDQGD
jgi:hypothetical protein